MVVQSADSWGGERAGRSVVWRAVQRAVWSDNGWVVSWAVCWAARRDNVMAESLAALTGTT